jgi:hypothetical protein
MNRSRQENFWLSNPKRNMAQENCLFMTNGIEFKVL